jgi:IS5 family transposase
LANNRKSNNRRKNINNINSFADSLVIEHKSLSELDDVHNIINWGEIEQTLSNLYISKTGASAYPSIMMFKILILQAWYALSDEALVF